MASALPNQFSGLTGLEKKMTLEMTTATRFMELPAAAANHRIRRLRHVLTLMGNKKRIAAEWGGQKAGEPAVPPTNGESDGTEAQVQDQVRKHVVKLRAGICRRT